ncbi:hypothetical protein ACJ41O_005902 [Fusarium nematophilum]
MLFNKLFFAALAASGASAGVSRRDEAPVKFGCATEEPSAEHIGMSKVLAAQEARAAESGNLTARATINVGVYFHVVASSQTVSGGYLTDKMLSDQLDVLNRDFAPHDIEFRLLGTDRTVNSGWSTDGNELAMKQSLRKGTYGDLNIYFQTRLRQNALGYAYLPTSVTSGSTAFTRDGVSLNAQTVPGGSATGYNLGKTGTHEVGHWLGLYHTFEGGCTGNGDFVSDTPAQASFSEGCPIGRDSCPSQPGLDPIHNYMDYSTDACYEEFTSGQEARMYSFWNTYRA